ncbi:hypothetical protein CDAR_415231 [Caerostris darwini]|uniref:Uncharacterized protein n=1 Tax=Caerostris darwini TaxID=1538125 RepID=A0AAV4UDH7_9ARAC|nr:hypothetical protein CDAR_415231 [Caerostris darwini]
MNLCSCSTLYKGRKKGRGQEVEAVCTMLLSSSNPGRPLESNLTFSFISNMTRNHSHGGLSPAGLPKHKGFHKGSALWPFFGVGLLFFLRVYPLDARTAVAERSDDTQLCVIRGTWLTVVGEGKDEALRDWFGIQ